MSTAEPDQLYAVTYTPVATPAPPEPADCPDCPDVDGTVYQLYEDEKGNNYFYGQGVFGHIATSAEYQLGVTNKLWPDHSTAIKIASTDVPALRDAALRGGPARLNLAWDGVTYDYAYGPGYFTRIESAEEFDAGLAAGLWPNRASRLTLDEAGLAALKDLCLRGVPKDDAPVAGDVPPAPPARPTSGTSVGRGYVYLDEFAGANPVEKLRTALTQTNQAIVPLPGTTFDFAGSAPIVMTARKTIQGLGGPQNEFKSTWPIYWKGGRAALHNADNGSNYNGNKGWVLKDMCLIGQSGMPLIEQVAGGNQLNYVGFDGCSIDTWKYVLDGPCLGLWIGAGIYTNNIYGDFAYRFKGSDNQLFTDGGKLDFGGSQRNPNATNMIFSWMEKSYVGPIYVTGDPARCILIEGAYDRNGITFVGGTIEGRNAGAPSGGGVLKMTGGGATFVGWQFNFSAEGRGEKGICHITGTADASFLGCRWRRANNGWGPEIYMDGGTVDVSGARRVFTDRAPTQIELRKAGGTLLSADGTVRQV